MALIGKSGGDFTPHPKGVFAATVVDVIDRGMVESNYGGTKKLKHKFTLRLWGGQVKEAEDEKGEKFEVPLFVDQWLTLSSHERSKARQLVEQGLGRSFTGKEVKQGFDYEKLLGQDFQMLVTHNETKNGVYANIGALMPLQEGQEGPGTPDDYVREVKKDPEESRDARVAVEAENPGDSWEGASEASKKILEDAGLGPNGDEGDDLPF